MSKQVLTKSLGYKFKSPAYRTGFAQSVPKSPWPKPYQAPTSAAFGGTLGTPPATGTITGGTSTGLLGQAPGVANTNTPTAPKPAPVPTSTAPITSPTTDPHDPTYWTNVGMLNFAYNNAVAGLNTRDINAQTKLSDSLAEFNRTEPIDTRTMRENYNNQGLFYSGHLGEATGNLVADYARRRSGARNEFGLEHSDYLSSLTSLKDKLGLDVGAEEVSANQRQIDRDQASADKNTLAPGMAELLKLLTPSAQPVVTAQQTQPSTVSGGAMGTVTPGSSVGLLGSSPGYKTIPYTNSQGVKGTLHIYPDGRKVFVRA